MGQKPSRNEGWERVAQSRRVNPDTGPTPEGYNKNLREWVRLLLVAIAVALVLDCPKFATLISIASIMVIQSGTIFSIKNWIWGFSS